MKNWRVTLLPLLALMIGGCGTGEAKVADWSTPLFVETAPLSCPKPDPALRREFRSAVAAPADDTTDESGKPTISKGALKAKIDEMRVAIRRKNAAGNRAVNELERCASGASPTS